MKRMPILTLAGAMLAALAIMTSTAAAQTATGQITATVRDASGAVMSGVKVVVSNQQTGLTRETKTGSSGDDVVPLRPAGTDVVTAEQTGFKTAILSDVVLTVDQINRADLTLAPGAVSETVEVQSSALGLDTGSASVGHTITERQVTEPARRRVRARPRGVQARSRPVGAAPVPGAGRPARRDAAGPRLERREMIAPTSRTLECT